MGSLWTTLEQIVDETVAAMSQDKNFALLLAPESHNSDAVRHNYEYFLIQTHAYVVNTHPFLLATEETLKDHHDPFYQRLLKERAGKHAKEEARHDEWLVDDYVALGGHRDSIIDAPPNQAVMAYNAYYQFLATNPQEVAGTFGVGALLEGVAFRLGKSMAEKLAPLFGQSAVTFIWRHGATDEKHTQELAETCDQIEGLTYRRLPLEAHKDCQRIVRAASVVSQLYVNLMSYNPYEKCRSILHQDCAK